MISDIINRVKDFFKQPVKNPQVKGDMSKGVDIMNAQSWNAETHPKGRGPSYLVDGISYDGNGKLDVTYRDGAVCEYDDIPPEKVKEFVNSDSKGRWVHANLWSKPYALK